METYVECMVKKKANGLMSALKVLLIGIAYWKDGQLTFIHASSSAKKVIIQASSLRDYAEGIKSCKGVLVARPLSIH